MLDFLPNRIYNAIQKVNLKCVYEIRLRANKPIMLNYMGDYKYLGDTGLVELFQNALICLETDIEECIFHASEYSVYAIEEQIRKGFITTRFGERIGVAGEYIFDKGQPLAIRNISSLCIRMPHVVLNCADEIYYKCMRDRVSNLLIISPPGLGKTTILRDLARLISFYQKSNILICDERGEIAIGDIGNTCDVLRFCNKNIAFEAGIRSLRPDVIITDELSDFDCKAVKIAMEAGVYVIASAHFEKYASLRAEFLGLFDYYVILSLHKIGKVQSIYNRQGEEIFLSD